MPKLHILEDRTYWIGASSSPEAVRVRELLALESFSRPMVLFERLPISDPEGQPERMDLAVFTSLVASGSRRRIESLQHFVQASSRSSHPYLPERIQEVRAEVTAIEAVLAGAEQPAVSREDCARYTVFIASPADAGDIWGAIDRATGGCCNSRTNEPDETGCHVYECTAFDLAQLENLRERFDVRKVRWGQREVDLPRGPETSAQPASASIPDVDLLENWRAVRNSIKDVVEGPDYVLDQIMKGVLRHGRIPQELMRAYPLLANPVIENGILAVVRGSGLPGSEALRLSDARSSSRPPRG